MFIRNILIQVSLCPGVFSQFLSLIMDGVTCGASVPLFQSQFDIPSYQSCYHFLSYSLVLYKKDDNMNILCLECRNSTHFKLFNPIPIC